MTTHELKVWPEFFAPILSGEKLFELRQDDRGFRAGDRLLLREWCRSTGYTGREATADVAYLLCGPVFGLMPEWVCMSIRLADAAIGEDEP